MDSAKLKSRLENKLQALQEPKEERTVLTMGKVSVAPIDSSYIALTSNALGIINENLKNQPLSYQLFDIIKSPSGGATVFTVPGVSGNEVEKELLGVILDYTTPRAYWDSPDPIEGTPPSCYSADSLISYDGKACSRCPFNDFGSKEGDSSAKACKESVMIFLLRPNHIIPTILRVPVSSKLMFLKYTTRLVSSMTLISSVVTRITLEKATSKQGKPFATYNFEAVGSLSDEEADAVKTFGQKFMEMLNAAPLEHDVQAAG